MTPLTELFRTATPAAAPMVVRADGTPRLRRAYARLRHAAFVERQGLFAGSDRDAHDDGPDTVVLVAAGLDGEVHGGVRLHPEGDPALGWWRGSRLVCARGPARGHAGAALVRAACAAAVEAGALRFDAHVQERHVRFFARLGWAVVRPLPDAHVLMRWDVPTVRDLVARTKAPLGALTAPVLPGGAFLGDDGAPVPGTGVVAAVDGILPAMVERDPVWAGWCGMLVTAHDLAAMGAAPVGALDALGARDAAHAGRVLHGLRAGAQALDLPILGGHTTLGAGGSLSVTGLGRTDDPVPAGGGAPGDALTLAADLEGGWRPGYGRTQWDSSTRRTREELRAMLDGVAAARPRAAKDVSMAGVVGTAGMLAEASGCGATLDVAAIPAPGGVAAGHWLTCFPGFAMLTADRPGAAPPPSGPAVAAACGRLDAAPGVRLRWPDGEVTTALAGAATGFGPARPAPATTPEDLRRA